MTTGATSSPGLASGETSPTGSSAASHRYRSLDSLRGVAALAVVGHHVTLCMPEDWQARHPVLCLPFLLVGRCAVILFFVLSGFVLALPYFSGKSVPYTRYVSRRMLRLYPPFAFAVLLAVVLRWWLGGHSVAGFSSWFNAQWTAPLTGRVIVAHLLTEGVGMARSIGLDVPIWSLLVEIHVSLIFPMLVWYVTKTGRLGAGLAFLVPILCLKAQAALHDPSVYCSETTLGEILLTIRYACIFVLGVFLAAKLRSAQRLVRRVSPGVHGILLAAGAGVWIVLAFKRGDHTHRSVVDAFSAVSAMYLILLSTSFARAVKHLSHRLLLLFGDVSFSLYLIHVPVFTAVCYLLTPTHSFPLTLITATAAALLSGYLMHHCVEKPAMLLSRGVGRPGSSRGESEASVTPGSPGREQPR